MNRKEAATLDSVMGAAWQLVEDGYGVHNDGQLLEDGHFAALQDVQNDIGMLLARFRDGPEMLTIDPDIVFALGLIEEGATDLLQKQTKARSSDGRPGDSREDRRRDFQVH